MSGLSSHRDDDFRPSLTATEVPNRIRGVAQRIRPIDRRAQLPGLANALMMRVKIAAPARLSAPTSTSVPFGLWTRPQITQRTVRGYVGARSRSRESFPAVDTVPVERVHRGGADPHQHPAFGDNRLVAKLQNVR